MATMNISLPDPMKTWIETRLKQGEFSNTSDYVRHLIRRDQQREAAIATIQQAIDEGLSSGEPEPFDAASFNARMREQHGAK
ncbi:antitoxin ParD1/3/4 [Sinorhizobium fredii]|uniref:Putative addiction module antidote protein, family n=1 Tax=Sinorhizobium fredii (strain USDA 257) TaxID=1185652 RepID=I3X6G4_SINF2|nr:MULTISPECIES: type II toxin-antitoxin system ParD family antitoxin [Sinorhizobium]AFL51470.1 putative addiction module antidote protein, family [Sinorhizobium fredii USDA 257]PDT82319.1 type II toxin-antitoxin system ParD family antitoxin [Sinorhizobium sp. BJ1]